jgi:CheY-like chemotaxis protein
MVSVTDRTTNAIPSMDCPAAPNDFADSVSNGRERTAKQHPHTVHTVLCVHDLPEQLELRKAVLESRGYSVKTASSSYILMKMLEDTSFDAVLLEYKVEGMDAEAVACHIKQQFPDLPIILLSAFSEMPERILWLVDEYVMKSELPDGLLRTIERVLRTKQAQCSRVAA